MKSLKALQGFDLEKVAKAIEANAGEAIPELRASLAEAKAGQFAHVHTPEAITARKRGRPLKESTKVLTTIRFDQDVLAALRATGAGWQTRVNDLLRADIEAGRLA